MIVPMLKSIFPKWLRKKINHIHSAYSKSYKICSYSQEGEDIILNRIFENKANGFYIDVGAHHPKRFSNTFFFYKKGWSGINIDAMPGSMKLFNFQRPRDINIEQAISEKEEVLTYYSFNEPALNGFSKVISDSRNNQDNYHIISSKKIKTSRLDSILNKYMTNNDIDFLSIDVEGLDFQVIRSLDLVKFQPKVILIEILCSDLKSLIKHEITIYLEGLGYTLYAKAVNTVIFKYKDFQ
jgi:FkbM family methyltransferase